MTKELILGKRSFAELLALIKRDVEEATTFDQRIEIAGRLEAAEAYAKRTKASRDGMNRVAELRLWNERYMGEMLDGDPHLQRGGDHKSNLPGGTFDNYTLKDVGITWRQSTQYRRIKNIPEEAFVEAIADSRAAEEPLTAKALLKLFAASQGKEKREASRNALPFPDGMDLRIGDCREVLADIVADSVPLILTDPPYGIEAEENYHWLAQWASRVLMPGGSLICYTGQSMLNRDIAIFDEHLRYWWQLIMLHDQSQRLAGKFVIANFKPVLWYVKQFRRGRTLVPDVLKSGGKDKAGHDWGQGDGGVWPLIEHLTDPGETIVDPFAGTATWGRIAEQMGRRWIGADLVTGGDTIVFAEAQ